MGSTVNTNFTENNNATQDVHSNVEHNITNTNHYNDHTEEGHLYKKDFIAGNFNNLDRVVNDGHQVFHLMNLRAVDCDHLNANSGTINGSLFKFGDMNNHAQGVMAFANTGKNLLCVKHVANSGTAYFGLL